MEIKAVGDKYQLHTPQASPRIQPKVDEISVQKDSAKVDTVDISPSGSFRARLDTEVRKYSAAAKQENGVSELRIAALKIKYQGDSCPVSSGDLADSMFEKVCGAYKK